MAGNLTSQPQKTDSWTRWHTFSMVVIILAIILVGLQIASMSRYGAWLVTMIFLAIFAIIAGHGITGQLKGLLIDERNRTSLSRLQLTLWTIIVLSGILTAALSNLANGQTDSLSIAIPSELWLLMGISITSLVGSPLIRSTKVDKKPDSDQKRENFDLMAERGIRGLDNQGLIVINATPKQASWSNLFEGEETGNIVQLDLGKVQMFYFTLILVFAYAAALGTALNSNAAKISEFPALDPGMVTLLGISNAGYLINKAVPHSKENGKETKENGKETP